MADRQRFAIGISRQLTVTSHATVTGRLLFYLTEGTPTPSDVRMSKLLLQGKIRAISCLESWINTTPLASAFDSFILITTKIVNLDARNKNP